MFQPVLLPRKLEAALADVQHKKSGVRLSALRDLALFREGEERQRAIECLARVVSEDEDEEVRAQAAVAIADLEGREVVGDLVSAACDRHPRVRQMALMALGELGSSDLPPVKSAVLRAVRDRAPALRFQAVVACGRLLPPDELTEVLVGALNDADEKVRHIALRVVEEAWVPDSHGDDAPDRGLEQLPTAFADKVRRCLDDSETRPALAAAILAVRLGEQAAGERLAELLNAAHSDLDPEDESGALELVAQHRIEAARPGLERRAWGLWAGRFAWQARVALAALGDERAERHILRGLRAWSYDARTLSVVAAGRARLRSAASMLRQMRSRPRTADPDAVGEALRSIEAS